MQKSGISARSLINKNFEKCLKVKEWIQTSKNRKKMPQTSQILLQTSIMLAEQMQQTSEAKNDCVCKEIIIFRESHLDRRQSILILATPEYLWCQPLTFI